MSIDRRDFLKAATAGAGLSIAGVSPVGGETPAERSASRPRATQQSPEIVVIGAGSFGMWTAYHLIQLGASVRVVDPFGAGNSRQTSGGETRGVRTSYGDRPHGLLWKRWVNEAIQRWIQWDEENSDLLLPRVFFQMGDLIMREEMEPYLEDTRTNWDEVGVEYEVLTPGEINHRWPWIRTDLVNHALYEPQAGVVRARRAMESVAERFRREGGDIQLARAMPGESSGGRLTNVTLEPEGTLSAEIFIFALGPWYPYVFPELMGKKMRTSIGHTIYFAVPSGDNRFIYPNMPSYGVPSCTGWPALGRDHRGFRVRTGGRPAENPETSDRWIAQEFHERPREILEQYFPDLVGAPISETRACHYESTVDRNWIIDKHPDYQNAWIIGGGSAEAFKSGPVIGEYIAKRVLGIEDDPELAEGFRLKDEEFEDEEEERDPGDESRGTPDFDLGG